MGNPVHASSLTFNDALVRLAVLHGKAVVFGYAKGAGQNIEVRQLEPQDVDAEGFVGFDPDRQATRRYRFDRVAGEIRIS